MEQLRQLKQYIIKTAPSYENMKDNRSVTSNMIHSRQQLGFTRIFYPGNHIEGELKIWDRRFRTPMFKRMGFLGPRGEVLVFGLFFYAFYRVSQTNFNREKLRENLNDRNVFFIVQNLDDKYTKM